MTAHAMMLRASTTTGKVNLSEIMKDSAGEESGVPYGAALIAFAEAVIRGSERDVEQCRGELESKLGSDCALDAVGVVAQFDAITRVADGTGIQLDRALESGTAEMRAEMGIDAFDTTR